MFYAFDMIFGNLLMSIINYILFIYINQQIDIIIIDIMINLLKILLFTYDVSGHIVELDIKS